MTERIRVIEHGIVLQDFSNVASPEEGLRAIDEARLFMAKQPRDGSVLVLTDVSGSIFNQKMVDAMRALAVHHRPWIRGSALVGLTAIMRIIYRAVVAITRREIKVCETRAQAVAYLLTFKKP